MTNQKNDCCQKMPTKLCEILIKLTPGDFPLAVAETCLGEMVEKQRIPLRKNSGTARAT